ncbi:MAG: type I 3-dehydroquinate dehydratase [Eubacterium sp.]|nr:type I 3-dehydroquinate dehydratase [Eubacterium sp.]
MITRKGITLGVGTPVICVPIVAEKKEEILAQIRNLSESGFSMIEWRADFFDQLKDPDAVRALLDEAAPLLSDTLLLFTIRTKAQGGQAALGEKLIANLEALAAGHAAVDLVDVEYLEFQRPDKHIRRLKKQDCIVITSHHDFQKTPDPDILNKLIAHMYADGTDIAKIAVMPKERADVLKLLELTNAVHCEWPDKLFVSMSMGGIGSISRVCGEVFGSCITFGSVGSASAPGQIEAGKLAQVLGVIHDSLEK